MRKGASGFAPSCREVTVNACAKINLSLDIYGKRESGYHDIKTVMQCVSLCDAVTVRFVDKPSYLKVVSDSPFVPADSRNLAYIGAKTLIDKFGLAGGVFIEIKKRIPVSAGLAGGSSDCAAVLSAVSSIYGLDITGAELSAIGASIGADVPFCLAAIDGCPAALCEGIGEIITPLPPTPKFFVLLIKPPFGVSTAGVFKAFDEAEETKHAAASGALIDAIKKSDRLGVCKNIGNALEGITAAMHPVIREIRAALISNGAEAAMMSGSGPTVFGLFESFEAASGAAVAVRKAHADLRDCFIVETL